MAVNARSVRVRARARVHCACKGVAALTCMPDSERSALEMPVEPRFWRLATSACGMHHLTALWRRPAATGVG